MRFLQSAVERGQRLSLLVAERLQELRQEQGLTLDQLAARVDLHRTSVGLVMRGQRGMTIASASSLASALGVRLSELLREAEQRLHSS